MATNNLNSVFSENKGRIEYIDSLRGFAILMVVYMHIEDIVLDTSFYSPISTLIGCFRMPLFFFISGFLSYSIYNKQLIIKRIKNRIFKQLIPTINVYILHSLVFSVPFIITLFDERKGGYWFTYVMVEVFFVYMLLNILFIKFKASKRVISLVLLTAALSCSFFLGFIYRKLNIPQESLWNLLSLTKFFFLLPFFFFGVISKMHFEYFKRIIHNGYIMLLTLIIFGVGFHFKFPTIITATAAILVIYRLFEYNSHLFSTNTKLGQWLSNIGRETLCIYLFHYFILRSLHPINDVLNWDTIQKLWLLDIPLTLMLAIIISQLCILVSKILRITPQLRILLLGNKK